MTYRDPYDPYADQYGGGSSNPFDNGQNQGPDQEICGSEDMQHNVYQLQQANTWSQDTNSYGQDQENTYEDGKRSLGNHHSHMSSYGYQSNYKYPPVQRTLTGRSVGALSRQTRPSVEVVPVSDQFRELGAGKDGFEKGEFTPNTPKKLATLKFMQKSY